jgi:hypothetical protein
MRFQLSIRDLLLAVAIIALAAGWFIDHQRINHLSVQKWEYKFVNFRLNSDFNTDGDQGWEVCGVGLSQSEGGPLVILKRPK